MKHSRGKAFILAALLLLALPCMATAQAHVTKDGIAKDGTTVALDLPVALQLENTGGSDGAGLCVFTSIGRAAAWQNVTALQGFRDYMRNFPGGGYPEKVDAYVQKLCKKLGEPVPKYLHYRGRSLEPIRLALKTGRMACVTYGVSPTYRYNGRKIYHMVDIVAAGVGKGPDGKGWWCVSDNNFPGTYEWMTESQFERAFNFTGEGWAVILLAPCPPPVPKVGATMNASLFSLVAALAIGQCENGKCLVPQTGEVLTPIGQAIGNHAWYQAKSDKGARLYRNGVYAGKFDYVLGVYQAWDGSKHLDPSKAPVDPPIDAPGCFGPDGDCNNFGLNLDRAGLKHGFRLGEKPISEKTAMQLLTGDDPEIPDDTDKRHLTVIVKGPEARRTFETWRRAKELGNQMTSYRVQVYDANDKTAEEMLAPFELSKDRTFGEKGSVAIVQAPGTTQAAPVLNRVYGFASPDELTKDLRKVDPNIDPFQPAPNPLRPLPSPATPSGPPWWIWAGLAVVAVGGIALTPRQTVSK